jgi:hypothetical protein
MKDKETKMAIVGRGKTGKTTLTASQAKEAEAVKRYAAIPPTFKTEEEEIEFMKQTEPIPLSKPVKMPSYVRTLGHYVKQYTLIQKKESKLTGSQRIIVKNIVHHNLRTGNLVLQKSIEKDN